MFRRSPQVAVRLRAAIARQAVSRGVATAMPQVASRSAKWIAGVAGAAVMGTLVTNQAECFFWSKTQPDKFADVRKDIEAIMDDNGPLLVRLAWHASGTYEKTGCTGGSNGASMRFPPESTDGANAGLKIARDLLEPIKAKYPDMSYADIWTLAGCVAIESMGGPKIEWRDGRSDYPDGSKCPENGRLPDATQGPGHVRDVFYRMGFDDREIVALLGAHTLGECHADRSGFVGPWTRDPYGFDNTYYTLLLEDKWSIKRGSNPVQFENEDGTLMMLPADIVIITDPKFKKYVDLYAKDLDVWFKDFAKAFSKFIHLGVPASK
jgi:cytochrome c peroxidase